MDKFIWRSRQQGLFNSLQKYNLGFISSQNFQIYYDKLNCISNGLNGINILYIDLYDNFEVSIKEEYINHNLLQLGITYNEFIFILDIMQFYCIASPIFKSNGNDYIQLKNHQMYAVQSMYAVENQFKFIFSLEINNGTVLYFDNHLQCLEYYPNNLDIPQSLNGQLIGGGLILDDVGLGKTIQTIAAIQCNNNWKNTLMILPNILMDYWISQFTLIYNKPYKSIIINDDNAISLSNSSQQGYIYFISKSQLTAYNKRYKNDNKKPNLFTKLWDRIIIDESHSAINIKSIQSNLIQKINARCKWFISATPVPNHPMQITSYQRHFTGNTNLIQQSVENQNFIILKRKRSDIYLQNKQEVIIDKIYINNDNAKIQDLNNNKKKISSMNITELQREQQNPSNFQSKSEYAIQYINMINKEDFIVIVCNYVKQLQSLQELLGGVDKCYTLYGSTTKGERQIIQSDFGNDINKRILIMTNGLGEVGLNLQIANHMMIFQPQWNESVMTQLIGRINRQNQMKQCYVILLIGIEEQEGSYTIDQHQQIKCTSKQLLIDEYDIVKYMNKPISTKQLQKQLQQYESNEIFRQESGSTNYSNNSNQKLKKKDIIINLNKDNNSNNDNVFDDIFMSDDENISYFLN